MELSSGRTVPCSERTTRSSKMTSASFSRLTAGPGQVINVTRALSADDGEGHYVPAGLGARGWLYGRSRRAAVIDPEEDSITSCTSRSAKIICSRKT
jgi:hypothetical protein